MRQRDRITLFLWVFFSLFICIESWRLGLGTFKIPGPGFLPFGAALVIGLLSFGLFLKGRGPEIVSEQSQLFEKGRIWKVIYTLSFLFLYPFAMKPLGFFLSTLLFIGFSLKFIEPQRWRLVAVMSILVAIVCYMLFVSWLKIQLPEGIAIDYLSQKITLFLWK